MSYPLHSDEENGIKHSEIKQPPFEFRLNFHELGGANHVETHELGGANELTRVRNRRYQ